MHAVVGGDGDAGAERMGAADLEAIVLHHVELVGQRIDGGVAEPLVIVPAEAALVQRQRAGEEHRELAADDRGRMALGGGVAGQRDAVAVQADLDALDLVRRQIVLAAHRDQRIERGMGVAAARIGLYADLAGSRRSCRARRSPCPDARCRCSRPAGRACLRRIRSRRRNRCAPGSRRSRRSWRRRRPGSACSRRR